jgi:adenylate cyclase
VVCLSYDAWCLWLLGFPERALDRNREALRLAQERAHPHDLAGALHYANVFDELRRDGQAVEARADALLAIAREQGYPIWLGFGHLMKGWARADQGQVETGLAELRLGVEALRRTGLRTGWPYYLALMVRACGSLGDVDEALRIQADAIEAGRVAGEHCWDAELWRLKGDLLRRRAPSDDAEAEACFRRAIETARAQQARSWELRAATSLSRLLAERGTHHQAREALADSYGGFTEGFDTADLRDARAWLDARP